VAPEVVIDSDRQTPEQAAEIVLASLPFVECAASVPIERVA
jgi:hypothetical protein